MTLFNQWMVPQDLQLPRPADPFRRLGAGIIDLLISSAAGCSAGAATWFTTYDPFLTMNVASGVALAGWVVRDSLGDGGNRSIGKRLYKVELAHWDGSLPTRTQALLRNWYFLVLPAMKFHALLDMAGGMLFVFDIASVMLTQDARKVGDYMFGTRVVDERPDRAARVAEGRAVEEIRMLRDEIEALAPGLLKSSEHPDDEWYETLQQRTMSNTEIIHTPRSPAAMKAAALRPAGARLADFQLPRQDAATAGLVTAAILGGAATGTTHGSAEASSQPESQKHAADAKPKLFTQPPVRPLK